MPRWRIAPRTGRGKRLVAARQRRLWMGRPACSGRSPTMTCTITRYGATITTNSSGRHPATTILYAGLFSPQSTPDLTGYLPQSTVRQPRRVAGQAAPASATPGCSFTTMCGNDNRDIAGLGDRSVPTDDPAGRRATRARARRSRPRLAQGGPGHQGRLSRRYCIDRAVPARRHANAHRGDDRGNCGDLAAVGKILRSPERRTEGEDPTALGEDQRKAQSDEDRWRARHDLRCRAIARDRLAHRRNRADGAPDRRATRSLHRARGRHRQGRQRTCSRPRARRVIRSRRRRGSRRPANGSTQAASGQDGPFGARRLLRDR